MTSDSRESSVLKQAQRLADSGRFDESVQLLTRFGAVEHAAAILMRAKRPLDAGRLLMDSMGLISGDHEKLAERIPVLKKEFKERSLKAAICFARAKELDTAVTIYVALAETRRAADLLTRFGQHARAARLKTGAEGARPDREPSRGVDGSGRSGDLVEEEVRVARSLEAEGKETVAIQHYLRLDRVEDAARVATKLGEWLQAAQLYAEIGDYYNAALCYHKGGERREALEHYLQVLPNHPQFREAQLQVAHVACTLDLMDFSTESFLAELTMSAPRDSREMEMYYRLGALFERHRMPADARRVYEQILLVNDYKDSRNRLSRVLDKVVGRANHTDTGVGLFEEFPDRNDIGALALPDLPAAPSLPSVPTVAPMSDAEFEAAMGDPSGPLPTFGFEFPGGSEPVQELPKLEAKKLKPGTVLDDRYHIEGKVGRGGMAAVYRAVDTELDELVAIKVFTRDEEEGVSLARFKQEVSLTRRLSHPNIVKLFDIGESHGLRFLTMELLKGRDLAAYLKRPVDLVRGLNWLVQMCRGLNAAHKAGIVHRDIKPANVFVCNDGRVKLMDFGIAKRHNVPGVTQKGLAWGTPRYMAPEQIRGFSKVNPASDLYSIGIIAYQMFTGQVPFDHQDQVPLLMMHINDKPRPPRELKPDLPVDLEAIILKCLQKKAENRYSSAKILASGFREVSRALEPTVL